MATIDDLKNISILQMSVEELTAHIQKIRSSRRARKKPVPKSRSKKSSPNTLINKILPEQAEAILKLLEGKGEQT